MPILQVVSSKPRAGKTMVATGLAQGFAAAGQRVRLLRAGSSAAARADAETFAEYTFASAPAGPVSLDDLPAAAADLSIVELDAGEQPLDARAIVVVRGKPAAQDEALARALGERLLGSIATLVAPGQVDDAARDLTNAGMRPLAVLPEDRRLAAPSVEDIRHALAADVLYEGENFLEAVEDVLVAPVYTDGARLHFERFSGTNAVLTPSYKTDLLLAAIEARASCLVITGGHRPSHYVLDRVQGEPTTILLAQHQTPAAVAALSDVWTASAFKGERKAEAIFSLLDSRLDWQGLLKKLS